MTLNSMHLLFIRFYVKSTFLFFVFAFGQNSIVGQTRISPGAESSKVYLPRLKNKKVGVVAHQASLLFNKSNNQHLVDFLRENDIEIEKIFAPEHGFRGKADNGEKIGDYYDNETGVPIISLYGKNKKPSKENLKNLDIVIFDLQDVGVRFYTYISTLHYVMEACAEMKIPVIVLDRPNPNLHYIDGPVLEEEYSSFIGMHPVPIVYGMTIGEYALMINGEGWLKNDLVAELEIIPIKNYTRKSVYDLPKRPSPNLPNSQSIALYPSLCLLEQTVISIGRGTEKQFQIFGHPKLKINNYTFKPLPNFGSKNPKHNGIVCYGKNLSKVPKPKKIELKWIIEAYKYFPNKNGFFLKGFNLIAGNEKLKQQLISFSGENKIRKSWEPELELFKKIRKKYLIYP